MKKLNSTEILTLSNQEKWERIFYNEGLGEVLVRQGLISIIDLDKAYEKEKNSILSLEEILINDFGVSSEIIYESLELIMKNEIKTKETVGYFTDSFPPEAKKTLSDLVGVDYIKEITKKYSCYESFFN